MQRRALTHGAAQGAVCFATVVAFVTAHELTHIAIGRWFHLGSHFASMTAAATDPVLAAAASAGQRALVEGGAPLFTVLCGFAALALAPLARRQRWPITARVLGWIALFGLPYLGSQLLLIGGPAKGVDSAGVLVDYYGIAGTARGLVALCGLALNVAAGAWVLRALGDSRAMPAMPAVALPRLRRAVAGALIAGSTLAVLLGTAVIFRHGQNPKVFLLLGLILASGGLVVATPWTSPGPRFVRDEWIAPAVAGVVALSVLGLVSHTDYMGAALFFMPQLAIAAYLSRHREWAPGPRSARLAVVERAL